MLSVKEVSRRTGLSVRALHYYDEIGLLSPDRVSESGYRYYHEESLDRIGLILLYRSLNLPLKEIRDILNAPEYDKRRVLTQQISLLEEQKAQLEAQLCFARSLLTLGGMYMDFQTLNNYKQRGAEAYGDTPAYKEYASRGKSPQQEQQDAAGLMALFARLGTLRGQAPDSAPVQAWVGDLQAQITASYYTCTKEILAGLGQLYIAGDEMTKNIDRAGGEGTAQLAAEAIAVYCK